MPNQQFFVQIWYRFNAHFSLVGILLRYDNYLSKLFTVQMETLIPDAVAKEETIEQIKQRAIEGQFNQWYFIFTYIFLACIFQRPYFWRAFFQRAYFWRAFFPACIFLACIIPAYYLTKLRPQTTRDQEFVADPAALLSLKLWL